MMDKHIKILRVFDEPVFEVGGNVRTRKVYTFMVGSHGPFTERFEGNELHPEAIERRLVGHVLLLRETGALPPDEPA